MDKFWKWMIEKGYSKNYVVVFNDKTGTLIPIPDQMMIGYMIEYVFDNIKNDEDFDNRNPEKMNPKFASVEQLYDNLKEIIEEM